MSVRGLMKKLFLVVLFVLGSNWFIPVSCTTGNFIGMRFIAKETARDMTRGETPHPRFYVMAELPNKKIMPISLSDLDRFRKRNLEAKYLLTESHGVIEEGIDKWEYSVIKEGQKQKIAVSYKGEDQSSDSLYLVDKGIISPLYSKILSPGHMFAALPYAIGFSLLLMFVSRFLYFRLRKTSSAT